MQQGDDTRDGLRFLLDLSIARLEGHDSAIARSLVLELRRVPDSVDVPVPDDAPHRDKLPDLATATDPLLRQLGRCYRRLHWRAPGFGRLPASLTDHMAVNELIGPTGQIPHETVRFGFLFQGPHVDYPDHNHAAEELYAVLRGEADWQIDGRRLGLQPAGRFVHHKPWESHAMKTGTASMLTMWGWVGDIGMTHYQLARTDLGAALS